jgi:hypothetical protein
MAVPQVTSYSLPEVSTHRLVPLYHPYGDEGRTQEQLVRIRRLIKDDSARTVSSGTIRKMHAILRDAQTDFLGDGEKVYTLAGIYVVEVNVPATAVA